MLRRLYDRCLVAAGSGYARWSLFAVSFGDSSVFPVPPDIMLIPMIMARRGDAWYLAGLCTFAAVLGALLGYALGYFWFEPLARPIIGFYGYEDSFNGVLAAYNAHSFWIIFTAAISPIPFKVITIGGGVAAVDLVIFVSAALVGRGLRYFALAAILFCYGEPVRHFIERHLNGVGLIALLLLVGGFVMVKWLF